MDPYVYPGTTILKNHRDIRDAERLRRFEAMQSERRLIELQSQPIGGKFDAKHLGAIHHYIFQDVYPWAGQFRTIDIAKSGQFYYALTPRIESALDTTFKNLKNEQHLKNLDPNQFCNRAAEYLGELNAVHPFRDGNGRSQREFMRQLALHNGYSLNWNKVSREEMYAASKKSFQHADNSDLGKVIGTALSQNKEHQPDRDKTQADIAFFAQCKRQRDYDRER